MAALLFLAPLSIKIAHSKEVLINAMAWHIYLHFRHLRLADLSLRCHCVGHSTTNERSRL